MKAFTLTEEDFAQGYSLDSPKERWLQPLFALVLFFFSIFIAVEMQWIASDVRSLALRNAIFIIVILLSVELTRRSVVKREKKNYQMQKVLGLDAEVEFSQDKLNYKLGKQEMAWNWSEILRSKKNDALILIYHQPKSFTINPNRAFESDEEKEQFLSYLKNPQSEQSA